MYGSSLLLASPSVSLIAMAFVGPVWNPHGYRPVGTHCNICNEDLLVWRCYACGGQYCGRCIQQHRDVPNISPIELDSGSFANDLAEDMHILWYRFFVEIVFGNAS